MEDSELAQTCKDGAVLIAHWREREFEETIEIERARAKIREYENLLIEQGVDGKNERERTARLELVLSSAPAVKEARRSIEASEAALAKARGKIDYEDRLFKVNLALLRNRAPA